MPKPVKPKPATGAAPIGGPVVAKPAGSGTIKVGGTMPSTPDTSLPPLIQADGKVHSWTAGYDGLTLVLRSEIGTTFSLQNTQPHYASVLSTIIAAFARDEKIVVTWRNLKTIGATVPLSGVGVGTDPVFI